MRASYEAIIAVTVLTVAASGQALAGDKGGGGGGKASGDGPKGNISLNYGKIEHTYTSQKEDAKKGQSGGNVLPKYDLKPAKGN